MLTALAGHYWRPDFSPAQSAVLLADFAEDLATCTIAEIENAIREYRRNPANKFFPKPGDLLKLVYGVRKERAELDRIGKPIEKLDSRPLMWWSKPRNLWRSHWRESDVPKGELVRDQHTGRLREPERMI